MKRSPTPFLLFPVVLLSLLFPRGRQMFSQLELTQPLTGGLEFKPELEELNQGPHNLPQKLWFTQASFFRSGSVPGKRRAHANVTQCAKSCNRSVRGTGTEQGEGSHKSSLPREAEKGGRRKEVTFSWSVTDEEFAQARKWRRCSQ